MEIDWFTVVAQIANFLILVWLLQRFLYGPVVRAMDRREQRVRDRLEDAERRNLEAQAEAQRFRDKTDDLEERRDAVLAAAQSKAEAYRHSLEDKLRDEVDATRERWREDLERERQNFLRTLRGQVARSFAALARQALGDLADAGLEVRIAEVFLTKLRDLDEPTRSRLIEGCREAGDQLVVRSSFELPAAIRERITHGLQELLGGAIEVDCQLSEAIACGIELRAGGQSVLWSLDAYLDGFESRLGAALGAHEGEIRAGATA